MCTNPTDADLESLFKIGRWHQPQPMNGRRLHADVIQTRANFVKEVIARSGRAAERSQLARVL